MMIFVCSLQAMQNETRLSYFKQRINAVTINNDAKTKLDITQFLLAYDALLSLDKDKDGQIHLRQIFNKCHSKYFTLDSQTVNALTEPLHLANGQFQDEGIQLLCTYVLTKVADHSIYGPAPVKIRAPKEAIARVTMKKKDENTYS